MILMGHLVSPSGEVLHFFFQNVLPGVTMICSMAFVHQEMGSPHQNQRVLIKAWRATHSVTAERKMSSAPIFLLVPGLVLNYPFIPLFPLRTLGSH